MVGWQRRSRFRKHDANPRSGRRGVMSPSSCDPCDSCTSAVVRDRDRRVSLMQIVISPSYRRCEDATLLVRLGGTPSSAEIMSWVKICATYESVGCGE